MLTSFSFGDYKNKTVAVALSGGSDSMALLYYMQSNQEKFGYKLIALNIEHGIRGQSSFNDTEFVKDYCNKRNVPIICYSVDSVKTAKASKLSIEQAARKLRYECFFDAIDKNLCDVVATAHHLSDLAESVIFNLLRGTGIKGAIGIKQNFENKIIRPFLDVKKQDIENYVKKNNIPFVLDETNLSDDYTRNNIRHNVIPKIKEIFPEAEKSIARFAKIVSLEDDFMDQTAKNSLIILPDCIQIKLPLHEAILARATIIAMRSLGIEKDWEKTHVDAVINLSTLKNGAQADLKNGIMVAKEYDVLTFCKKALPSKNQTPFKVGKTEFDGKTITVTDVLQNVDLKKGFYADLNKIPQTAVIRYKKDGDVFTKFGGGTKPLGEYLTDIKIPLRERSSMPVLADGNVILAIIGVAISEKIKVDENTLNIIKIQ